MRCFKFWQDKIGQEYPVNYFKIKDKFSDCIYWKWHMRSVLFPLQDLHVLHTHIRNTKYKCFPPLKNQSFCLFIKQLVLSFIKSQWKAWEKKNQLTSCIGDGNRNSLNLDPIDADSLHCLCCWGELRCVQLYHSTCRGNFCQSPLLSSSSSLCSLGAGSWWCDGGDRRNRGGRSCRRGGVLELKRLPFTWSCFKENLRKESN